jgi:hypothetical protein
MLGGRHHGRAAARLALATLILAGCGRRGRAPTPTPGNRAAAPRDAGPPPTSAWAARCHAALDRGRDAAAKTVPGVAEVEFEVFHGEGWESVGVSIGAPPLDVGHIVVLVARPADEPPAPWTTRMHVSYPFNQEHRLTRRVTDRVVAEIYLDDFPPEQGDAIGKAFVAAIEACFE